MSDQINKNQQKLILFDIDGTLLRTNGAGMQAIKQGMLKVFGECGTVDSYVGGGRSYRQIVTDNLEGTSVPKERIAQEFPILEEEIARILLHLVLADPHRIYPLPGGLMLIDRLRKRADLVLGLVTGNSLGCSKIKLEAAGYPFHAFQFNSYGGDAESRAAQVDLARMHADQAIGYGFPGTKTVMVGDTIYDVNCARLSGARSIIVSTGDSTIEELKSSNPDFLFGSLMDYEQIENAIFE